MAAKTMIVAGVMSGTSADGVDVALARISPGPRLRVLGHLGFPYPKSVRADVQRAMEGAPMAAAEFSRLHWRLGEIYADCVEKTCDSLGVGRGGSASALEMVGLHGQTVYHEALKATWQMGEAAVVRERLGVPVVSDFRPADLAAGGQGAPLVPMLDFCLYRSKTRNRVLLNLGGIANVSAIPAGAGLDDVLAFDTGPANMVVDAVMNAAFRKDFDRGGRVAGRGKVLQTVVSEALQGPFFAEKPPKSCGREQFGGVFASEFMEKCATANGSEYDAVTTATELTAASILDAYGRFCWPHLGQAAPLAKTEVIAAGGGVKNDWLMGRLRAGFGALGVKVSVAEGAQAKEAVAFALLAWLSWHRLAGNVPAATGALGPRVLGKVAW
jgi:anhydro-N-acetylmuramic acid kinase